MQAARPFVEPGQQVRARAERTKQLEVRGSVVVCVAQRRIAGDAGVHADDDREARRRLRARDLSVRASAVSGRRQTQ